jgi:hypothetical protein
MSKHTPGPWTFYRESSWDRGESYGVKAPAPHYWVVPTLNINPADAHLIAAAPDLLEALKNLLWYVGQLEMLVYSADDAGEHEEVAKARAAIAKAEEKNT